MKKGILFLGAILSVVNIANAETGMSEDVKARFEKNEAYVKAIRDKSMEVVKLANANLEVGKVNNRNIIAVNKETEANTDDIVEISKKMAIHQAESDIAIEKLEAQDKAIFEEIGSSRDANAKPIRENKIDKNREMILALERENQDITDTKILSENNKAKTEVNETNISSNKTAISDNSQRITNLDNKVDNLQGEMNKGFAMSAAMTSVDFQSLEVGEMGIGAGVGNYQNSQAVSLGLGLRATENLSMNVKGAMSTGTKQETMVGAGATYKIKIFGS